MPTLRITNGHASAVINLVGSALVGLQFGSNVLIPEINLEPKTFAGTLLAPWPNRIAKASYQFDGKSFSPVARDGLGNALHGLVDETVAEVVETGPGFAKLRTTISSSDEYPANLAVETSFELGLTELTVSYRVTNSGPGRAPVGIGAHPYFPFTDSTMVEINAGIASKHGEDMIPISEIPAPELGLGIGNSVLVSTLSLDTQFTELGNPVASVLNADFGFDIWQQDAPWLMVYTTESFPWQSGIGRAIAIEPQTCPADAFNSGIGLQVLDAGDSTSMRWGIRLRG